MTYKYLLLLPFAFLLACSNATSGGGPGQGIDVALGFDAGTSVDSASGAFAGDDSCFGMMEGAACDDGDLCTIGETCEQGYCVGGVAEACDAEGPCREGLCDPATGCSYVDAAVGTECTVSCFTAAACDAGTCEPDANSAVVCPESDEPCVNALGCDVATGECTHVTLEAEGFECDSDDDVCTLEICDVNGACEATGEVETCEDENANDPCWTWACATDAGCAQTVFEEGEPCVDGDPCTWNDACLTTDLGEKVCGGEPIPLDDGNPCTSDTCEDGEVVHAPLDGAPCPSDDPCSDGGVCTADVCTPSSPCECVADEDCAQPADFCAGEAICDTAGGYVCSIKPDSPTVCPAPTQPCHEAVCDPATGACNEAPAADGAVCDDGDVCTETEYCVAGYCTVQSVLACDDGLYCNGEESCDPSSGCEPGVVVAVNDGVGCTEDTCDETNDVVIHTPNPSICDNSLFCDGQETCDVTNDCQPGVAPDLSDGVVCTDDACDEINDVVTHTPNHASCDNALFCDGEETCDPIDDCQPGVAPEVSDGVGCTDDACDETNDVVTHTPNHGVCDTGAIGLCINDACDVNAGCVLEPATDCCGNGIIEADEECDDANLDDLDGCDTGCHANGDEVAVIETLAADQEFGHANVVRLGDDKIIVAFAAAETPFIEPPELKLYLYERDGHQLISHPPFVSAEPISVTSDAQSLMLMGALGDQHFFLIVNQPGYIRVFRWFKLNGNTIEDLGTTSIAGKASFSGHPVDDTRYIYGFRATGGDSPYQYQVIERTGDNFDFGSAIYRPSGAEFPGLSAQEADGHPALFRLGATTFREARPGYVWEPGYLATWTLKVSGNSLSYSDLVVHDTATKTLEPEVAADGEGNAVIAYPSHGAAGYNYGLYGHDSMSFDEFGQLGTNHGWTTNRTSGNDSTDAFLGGDYYIRVRDELYRVDGDTYVSEFVDYVPWGLCHRTSRLVRVGTIMAFVGCMEAKFIDLLPGCGNSFLGTGEECDDGNTVNGDGCSNSCRSE